ncbi:MAG: S8 family serine peptidase [Candidatus Acetothermia bacterium]|jgi:hypothetical protein|nr:S8 family serine peptidase [Candidatus Acetothermia bacterium]
MDWRRLALKIALTFLSLALALSPSGGHSAPEPEPPPKPAVAHHPKIETALALGQAEAQGPGGSDRARVSIELAGPVSPGLLAELSGLGVVVEAHSANVIRALLSPDELEALAELPEVAFIRRPYRPIPLLESLGPIGAILFQAHNFKGQGVKIAVIDVGFAGLSWAISQGVLPRGIIGDATDYTGEGLEEGTNHGTAVAELAHEVAPQATLYLKKIGDEVDLADAVDDCLRQGVKIIVHSVGWFNTNFTDGKGIVAEIAERASRLGILWVNAAGNHAQQHWTGPFRDLDGDGWVEFQGPQEELRVEPSFGQLQLFLTWDDWPRTCQDYDLFVYSGSGELLASSQNYQTCSEPPTEELDYLVLQPGAYYVRVLARNKLKPAPLKVFSANARLEPAVPRGSLPAPADARGVLAVGAIPIGLWETGPAAAYSSQGPTSDGRVKPDLVAPDNVWTATEVGFLHRFSGTSAAAPQVAGAAALLLSQHPEWAAGQVWEALEESSIDIGLPGKDNIYGAGRLNLSLGQPRASREITSLIQPGDQAVQGDSLLVTVRLVMPPSRFGSLIFEEQIPPGFRLEALDNGGAEFDPRLLTWAWPIVDPGSGRTIRYRLIIPPGQAPGSYRLDGRINGGPVEGEAEIRVLAPLTVPAVVAHWDVERGLIDLELGEQISSAQLEQAIAWWLTEAEVPGSAGRIVGADELERLVAYQLTGSPVSQPLPSLETWEVATAERNLAIEADGSVAVTVAIQAHARAYGLRLDEAWPASWRIEPRDDGGAVRKGSEWLWPRLIEPGEVLIVRYRARPLLRGEREAEVQGLISSALPRFSYLVGGEAQADSTLPPPQIQGLRFVRRGGAVEFHLEGQGIAAIRLRLFNLAGRRLYDSGWVENGLLLIGRGEAPLANGVYLYALTVRGPGGRESQRLGKAVLLR